MTDVSARQPGATRGVFSAATSRWTGNVVGFRSRVPPVGRPISLGVTPARRTV